MKSGHVKSCGCLLKKSAGLSKSKLYKRWIGMKTRCYNLKTLNYNNYGGRGIAICEKWKYNFMVFYKWALENGWDNKLQIDRIDNNGDYSPENCRFVTMEENGLNKRVLQRNNTSNYVGVSKSENKYRAYVTVDKKRKYLGYFKTALRAAKTRDQHVIKNKLNYRLNCEICN